MNTSTCLLSMGARGGAGESSPIVNGETPPPITFLSVYTQRPRDSIVSRRMFEEKNFSNSPVMQYVGSLFQGEKFFSPLSRVQLYKENRHLTPARTGNPRCGFPQENMRTRNRDRKKIPFWINTHTHTHFSRKHRDTVEGFWTCSSGQLAAVRSNMDLISHAICRMVHVIHTRNPHTNRHSTSRLPRNTSSTEYKVRGARRTLARRRRALTGSDRGNEDLLRGSAERGVFMGECLGRTLRTLHNKITDQKKNNATKNQKDNGCQVGKMNKNNQVVAFGEKTTTVTATHPMKLGKIKKSN